MNKPEIKKSTANSNSQGQTIDMVAQPVGLHDLDIMLGEAFVRAEENEVSPQLIVQVAARHAAEYGSSKTMGASALVVTTILAGVLDGIHQNLPRQHEEDFGHHFNVEINHVWKKETNGNPETFELVTSIFKHLCDWLNHGMEQESQSDSETPKRGIQP